MKTRNHQPNEEFMVFHCFGFAPSLSVMYSDGGVAMAAVVTFNVDCMELRRFLKIYFKTASFSLVLKFARVLLI